VDSYDKVSCHFVWKSSTVNLVNLRSPGYRWSARWGSLVRYLNVDPSPPTSTSRPPDVIHVIGVPRPSLFFALFRFRTVYYTERKPKNKKTGEAWERGYEYTVPKQNGGGAEWVELFITLTKGWSNQRTGSCCLSSCPGGASETCSAHPAPKVLSLDTRGCSAATLSR